MTEKLREKYYQDPLWADAMGVSFVKIPDSIGKITVSFHDHAKKGRWVQQPMLDALVALLDEHAKLAGPRVPRHMGPLMDVFAPPRAAAGRGVLGERRGAGVVDLEVNHMCVARGTRRPVAPGELGVGMGGLTVEDDRTMLDRLRQRGIAHINSIYLSAVTGPTSNGKDHFWPSRHATGLAVDVAAVNGLAIADIFTGVAFHHLRPDPATPKEHPIQGAVWALQLLFKGRENFGPYLGRKGGNAMVPPPNHNNHLHLSVEGVHDRALALGLLGGYQSDGIQRPPSDTAVA